MSTGYFFSNPEQHHAPVTSNVRNIMSGDDQESFGSNGGYNNHGCDSSKHNSTIYQQLQLNNQHQIQQQQQLNQHNIQQMLNLQRNQFQVTQQNFNQGDANQQQQIQQLIYQQQLQHQLQCQTQPQLQQLEQNQRNTMYLSKCNTDDVAAFTAGQTSVPNPLAHVRTNEEKKSSTNVVQSSFFGNLFNQLNFFANNGDNNSSFVSNSSMNDMGRYTNQFQASASTLPEMDNFAQQGNMAGRQLGTPIVSMSELANHNETGPSPMPMAFMTPRMSLTPNPPTNPPTPLMTPRTGMTPDPLSDTLAPPPSGLNEMIGDDYQQNEMKNSSSTTTTSSLFTIGTSRSNDITTSGKAASTTKSARATTSSVIADAQKSFFRRGINSVGSALTVVANYINESLLSGIPFHIADRAMRESKETYAKWWEGGINDTETDDEENPDDSIADDSTQVMGNGGHVEKRRKLDSGEGLAISSVTRGSALSASLEKNYNAVGIDVKMQTGKLDANRVQEHVSTLQSMSHSKPMEVDSSIIKRRRRTQFDHENAKDDPSGHGGYDMFNNIDFMYDNDASKGDKKDPIIVPSSEYGKNGAPATTATTITSQNTINGTMNAIKELFEEKNNVQDEHDIYDMISSPRRWVTRTLRSELIDALQSSQGDTKDKRFLSSLEILSRFYKSTGRDARANPWSIRKVSDDTYAGSDAEAVGSVASDLLEGSWVNMSRPNYVECLGKNKENDFMYTLGRMSFDMFQPGDLICSVQSTHNNIRIVGEQEELPAFVPKSLKEEVASLSNSNGDSTSKRPLLRSYDIAVSMTLEPPASVQQPEPTGTPTPTKRLRAIIAVKGYVLPDPHIPNRLTVWFTGGKLCPATLASNEDEEDEYDEESPKKAAIKNEVDDNDEYGGFEEWTALFSKGKWRKTLGERARAMAAKLLLGADIPNKMEEDGHMEYSLHRPVGGHSKVYVDVLYLDEDILIMRGHRGTIYAMARSGISQRYAQMAKSNER